jgi:FAD binding domain/Putative transposase DNA-binding domain
MTQQIVVIGAGIAGLASAVALQRQGHDVSVIESRTDTSTGAAITIWPNALAALDEIGLGDAVRDAGGRMTAGAMRWHDGSWLRHPGTETWVSVLGEPLAVVQRSALSDILTGALRPGTIEYRGEGRGLVAATDEVRIRLADATVRHAAALIGADGIGSKVAYHLNGPLTLRYTGYTAWRGIATCGMDSELGGQTLGPGVEVGHIPMGPDRTYWFTTQRAPEGQLSPEGVASCCGLGGRQLSVVCCRKRSMNLAAWAERSGVARVTTYRWFPAGLLLVSGRVGRRQAGTGATGGRPLVPFVKTCHACGHVQDIGWAEQWQCGSCSITHQRDDNAAINLARYDDTGSVVGPVGAAVKRGADRKTGPRPAGGCEARKRRSRKAAEQPRAGVRVA